VTDLLVIGYGNDLRRDDGAGRAVAAAIEERSLPGVTVRSVSQLTPELALEIAGRRSVVFVDADLEVTELTTRPVAAGDLNGGVMTHHGDPASLLSLVATVGPLPEEAVVVSIPARDLGLGFEFSAATAAAVARAVDVIAAIAEG
jgi:hydrogenase maturation protease